MCNKYLILINFLNKSIMNLSMEKFYVVGIDIGGINIVFGIVDVCGIIIVSGVVKI